MNKNDFSTDSDLTRWLNLFFSMAAESFYAVDIKNDSICHVQPNDMFLCGYSIEDVMRMNDDFYSKIVYSKDLDLWTFMRKLVLQYIYNFEEKLDEIAYFSCTFRLQRQFAFLNKPLPQIEKYRLNPVYTGKNIRFFEENVFLSKEDILSSSLTIKDFFAHQAINIYDFGKITIMPNGDAYANVNHPTLGNIYMQNIHEIVQNEITDGKSWFRIRNQAPCNDCVYQWLCPSPSNYEIAIGRPNLCHIKQ